MATLQDIYKDLHDLDNTIATKGGTIYSANLSPSMRERHNGIVSIPQRVITLGDTTIALVTAELPGRTITVYPNDSTTTPIGTANTPATTGGEVSISIPELGTYRVICTEGDVEKWNRIFAVSKTGINYCKAGVFQNYNASEIQLICDNQYADLMWSIGDELVISPFMGSTNNLYTTVKILGWSHYELVNGGQNNMTLGFWRTSSSYKLSNYLSQSLNSNKGSWTSSVALHNCLKSGDTQYILDETVTNATTGTYYVYDIVARSFTSVTLPGDYVEDTKYYIADVKTSDGAFIAGLPAEWQGLIKEFYCETWTGAGLDGTLTDETKIRTRQWLTIPSAYEIFGEGSLDLTETAWHGGGRWLKAKIQEGEQLEYYRTQFSYNNIFSSTIRWTRSPLSSTSSLFLLLDSFGNLTYNSATYSYSLPLVLVI